MTPSPSTQRTPQGVPNDDDRRPRQSSVRAVPSPEENRPGLRELLSEDLVTYDGTWTEPGFVAVAVHRLGKAAESLKPSLARALALNAYKTSAVAVDWVFGIKIPLSLDLGRRVRIWHHGCILLEAKAIGDDVHIRHDTTLGAKPFTRGAKSVDDLPTIQDGADLGSGVCILGPVTVGSRSMVAANSLVLKDVPSGSTVLGVPARVMPT